MAEDRYFLCGSCAAGDVRSIYLVVGDTCALMHLQEIVKREGVFQPQCAECGAVHDFWLKEWIRYTNIKHMGLATEAVSE